MPKSKRPRSAESTLPRRQIAGILALGCAIIAVSIASLIYLYSQSREQLDRELGQRLQQVAVAAATTVPGDSLVVWWVAERPPVAVISLERRLRRVEQDNALARIVVYQEDWSVLVDTSQILERGEHDPFLALDRVSVEQARVGIPSYSNLREVSGAFLKAGYAPVLDDFGEIAGFVGVVASARFFETLRGLRQSLLLTGVVVFVLVGVLTAVYVGYARRLARARAALQRGETLAAMGRMAAGIAHEIRNPLGIIKNTAQLLREELRDEGHSSDLVEFIPTEVDRLNETLTGYLEFAQDKPMRFESTQLGKLLRRTVSMMQPDFQHADVELHVELEAIDSTSLEVDPRRIQQVFLNLVLNALQAMPDGGSFTVRGRETPGEVVVELIDTGVGMSSEQIEHAFEAFFTSKEKGSGLGLSVAHKIVEEHGGRIEISSTPGEGTAMLVRLPASRKVKQGG